MPLSYRYAAQCCARQLRSARSIRVPSVASQRKGQRYNSTEATKPKISGIVDQISQLTLLETADLISSLKSRLNIPDMPIGGFAAGPSPTAAQAGVAAEPEEEAPAPAEKTLFTVKLMAFEPVSKPKVIKEIKSLLGLSLVDSKKFVEAAPKVMKESVPKDEAEKMMATLKDLGATVTME